MTSNYMIETAAAVEFLSLTMCFYLWVIYRGARTKENRSYVFLAYSIIATVGGTIEVWHQIARSFASALASQIATTLMYFVFMKYIASFGTPTPNRKRMLYAQNVVMGIYFYLQLVGLFTGANYSYSGGALTSGSLAPLLGAGFTVMWTVWTWTEIHLYRRAFTRGQLWALIANLAVSWSILLSQSQFFPQMPVHFVIIAVNLYYYFFLLETPAYRDLEKTLERLRKAKEIAEEAKQAAIAADAAKGEFLANMSHEIRTPLTTILGMDEVILRKYESGPIYEYARDIQSAGN
ncbi:MAG: hypothetical protein IJU31_04740, partial [Synergistaceae bacterium]|nr:hypothetical protein [Synergistaceae bacterium]